MSLLISNALLYGVLLSATLALIMGVSFGIAPDMWVGDYPPDIRACYGEMSSESEEVSTSHCGSLLWIGLGNIHVGDWQASHSRPG